MFIESKNVLDLFERRKEINCVTQWQCKWLLHIFDTDAVSAALSRSVGRSTFSLLKTTAFRVLHHKNFVGSPEIKKLTNDFSYWC